MLIETSNPDINVDELMARIRAEAARLPERNSPVSGAGALTDASSWEGVLPRARREPAFTPRDVHALADFLDAHDEAFVRRAYRGLLGREPDASGLQNYLEQLRGGRVTRLEILGRLRYSPEGRTRAVRVRGLLLPFVIATAGRLPVLGYFLRWLLGLLRLPTLTGNFARFENHTVGRLNEAGDRFDQGMADCERALADLDSRKADAQALAEALARIEALERQLAARPGHPVP